ncbi:non-ribosomal peptide synthetase [Mycobacterium bourgelatii]|uniref:Non-ribosomal peptide synthetase n=1 Tax=Mycobacterium bourgelatii TaxID=1273442 RepID=A0A7I9YRD9_MYCBU|nr:non-ribosomal peptide synthetase [Mycobacterium bourgelatii]MCV6974343.1 amino acid adenylation domain-containing protein [Mycobacterium bourgelatii]GFG91195.1 non-ribosomal peptide synthetase [Mycobacterium bourgelatii]
MSAVTLIDQVRRLGVQLWVDGENLRFRAPQGVLGPDLKAALSAAKADVIAELARETEVLRAPEDRFEPFPLTDVQAAYSVGRTSAFRWGGVGCHGYAEFAVDHRVARPSAAQYRSAWSKVVDAHDMLRCVVDPDGYQIIRPDLDDRLSVLENPDRKQISRDRARIAGELKNRVYPLGEGPMYDIVVTIGPDDAVVHVSVDLLIADFVSIFIVMTDFGQALLDPEYVPPAPEFSFREYLLNLTRHRNSVAGSRRRQRDLDYWRARLEELPPPISLPLLPEGRGRDAGSADVAPTFSRRSMRLAASRFTAFGDYATERGATASVAIATAFSCVLGRYGDRDHFLLTLTTMARHPFTPDVGRLVGDFTGTSVLEVDVRGQRPFAELLGGIGRRLFEDMDHAGVDGIEVARMLAQTAENRDEHSPVVLTSTLGFDVQSAPFLRPIPGRGLSQTPQVLLDCQVFEIDGVCEINWDTRDGAISDEVLDRAFADFRDALEKLSSDPLAWDQPLLAVSAPQRTPVPLGGHGALIHSGFLQQAARTPDAVAIRHGERSTTYGELLAAAHAVAAELSAAGAGIGGYVGIRLPAGPSQVAAILGTALTGAAYVPLDVAWPDHRVALITQQCSLSAMCEPGGRVDELLADPATWLPRTTAVAATPATSLLPDSTAYVIFTSGSTGTPKGVMVSHRAAWNTIDDVNDRLDIQATDSVLAVSQHTFDLSVYNIFGLLAAGGAIVFAAGAARNDPQAWADAIAKHRVTVWNSVPAQMQLLLDHLGDRAMLPSLRRIMLSGDWIPVSQPKQIASLAPEAAMLSLGGATEAAIWSICYPLEARRYGRSVPYGTAMRNQSVHVLTHRGEPAAPWQIGEIHIGGVGLAQGYLGDPDRTAAAFIEHPVSGERLYRTGDFGRYTDDGVIELLGRRDNQVKIRGHRIELAEVDSALCRIPGVRTAMSAAIGQAPHDRIIAAAVVPGTADDRERSERRCSAKAVRHSLDKAHQHQTADLDGEKLLRFAAAARTVALQSMCAALGTVARPGEPITVDELAQRLSLPDRLSRLLRRWLDALDDAGMVTMRPGSRLELPDLQELSDCAAQWQRVRELGAAVDYGDDLLAYVGECIENLPGLLAGTVDPLGLLFREGTVGTATAAYRDNLISQYTNRLVVSGVAARASRATAARPLRVLEVGAGVGGTSADLVTALAPYHVRYTFTDVSNFFLLRASQTFADHDFIDYRMFDINRSPAEQGFSPQSFDVIVCANVLHNAVNIDDTLVMLDRLLTPGGSLVFIDATGVNHPLMISMEFKEGLHGFTDARAGTNAAFLSYPQWVTALQRSPFGEVCSFPPAEHPLGWLGQHVFWCDSASTAHSLRSTEMIERAGQLLPSYMIPQHLICLPTLPLTANGKVDRAAVTAELEALRAAARLDSAGGTGPDGVACQHLDGVQSRIADIWASVLGLPSSESFSPASDFFALGGDSLLMAQAIGRIRREIPEASGLAWDDLLRAMVSNPSLGAAAEAVRGGTEVRPAGSGHEGIGSPLVYLGAGQGFTPGTEIAVCVHDGSGGLAPYAQLVPQLLAMGEQVPDLYGLQRIPGDGYAEIEPAQLFTTLAARYSAPIVALAPTKVHLFGYCMGGLLAAEIAKCLEESGIDIGTVTVASSYRVPMDVEDDDILDYCFAQILQVPPEALGLQVDGDAIRGAFTRARARYADVIPAGALRSEAEPVLAECLERSAKPGEPRLRLLAESGVLGESWDVETLTELRSIFVHSLRAVVHGGAEPFLGDIHFLRQRGDIHFLPTLQEDMTAFWSDYCLGKLTVSTIDGNHFDCLAGENAEAVAKLLVDSWVSGP